MSKLQQLGFALLVFLFISAPLVFAEPVRELSYFLEDELISFDRAMANSEPYSQKKEKQESEFFWNSFWVRVEGNAGFQIPGLLKIKIAPEIEMVWVRERRPLNSFQSGK